MRRMAPSRVPGIAFPWPGALRPMILQRRARRHPRRWRNRRRLRHSRAMAREAREAAGLAASRPDARSGDPRGVALTLLCAASYGVAPAMAKLAYDAGAGVLTATTGRFVAGV